jgi:hypothetical protein
MFDFLRRRAPQSSSSSRFTAGAFAFFILSQSGNDAKAVILLITRLNAFG